MHRHLLVAILVGILLSSGSYAARKPSYFVIIDAGSTGCRLYLFSKLPFENIVDSVAVSGVYMVSGDKLPEPLSKYAERGSVSGAVDNIFRPLFQQAAEYIPAEHLADSEAFVFATAGMRKVNETLREAFLPQLRKALDEDALQLGLPLHAREENVRIISGEEEGFWGWLSANWLVSSGEGALPFGKWGMLDLGGASVQIVMPIPGSDNEVFINSFLDFGAEAIRHSVFNRLSTPEANAKPAGLDAIANANGVPEMVGIAADATRAPLLNPCRNVGYSEVYTPPEQGSDKRPVSFTGTGIFHECRELVAAALLQGNCSRLRYDSSKDYCGPNHLLLPKIPSASASTSSSPDAEAPPFFATSMFFYATNFVDMATTGALRKQGYPTPVLSALQDAGETYCQMNWETVHKNMSNKDPKTNERKLPDRCFEIAYVYTLLTQGLGFAERPASSDSYVRFGHDIDGHEVVWALGAFLQYEGTLLDGRDYRIVRARKTPFTRRASKRSENAFLDSLSPYMSFMIVALVAAVFLVPNLRRRLKVDFYRRDGFTALRNPMPGRRMRRNLGP